MSTIREIVFQLEARVEVLLKQFKQAEAAINSWQALNPFEDMEESLDVRPIIEEMITIFTELKPIEKLIIFKFKNYEPIFAKLTQIIHEKENGKFFSFLSSMPLKEKRPYNKKQLAAPIPVVQTAIDQPVGQTVIDQ